MYPEKLNLWDRIFNRYRKTIRNEGSEIWTRTIYGVEKEYIRKYVEYTVTDRLTGSQTIEKQYLN